MLSFLLENSNKIVTGQIFVNFIDKKDCLFVWNFQWFSWKDFPHRNICLTTHSQLICRMKYFDWLIYKFFLNFQHWELIVLSRLKWDISSITPLDFLELLLSRLPITHRNCTDINLDKIRKHAQAFISLAARGEQKTIHFLCCWNFLHFFVCCFFGYCCCRCMSSVDYIWDFKQRKKTDLFIERNGGQYMGL